MKEFFRKIVMVVIVTSVRAFDLRQKAGITHLIQLNCYTASMVCDLSAQAEQWREVGLFIC